MYNKYMKQRPRYVIIQDITHAQTCSNFFHDRFSFMENSNEYNPCASHELHSKQLQI